jgi:hypothetical protein
MRDAFFSEGAYEETPGVERLDRLFSGFPAEGVGGGLGYIYLILLYVDNV